MSRLVKWFLNNFSVSLVYELLKKIFLYDESEHIYLSITHAGKMSMFTLVKFYYINKDRSGNVETYICFMII